MLPAEPQDIYVAVAACCNRGSNLRVITCYVLVVVATSEYSKEQARARGNRQEDSDISSHGPCGPADNNRNTDGDKKKL